MRDYGVLSRLEHSCTRPGLWLIEGHEVARLPVKNRTQANPRGVRWQVLWDGTQIGDRTHHTFAAAVDWLADHIDKGCDCS